MRFIAVTLCVVLSAYNSEDSIDFTLSNVGDNILLLNVLFENQFFLNGNFNLTFRVLLCVLASPCVISQ